MAVTYRRERYNLYNGMVCLIQALKGKFTMIDLRNECTVSGKIDEVDGFMNVTMTAAIFTDARGDHYPLESFYVQARNIRYVHIPDEVRAH
uniref:Sm domain-containing protein n=2 Tax=Timema TaxID=61471 RepID=A0A7R9E3I4_9NEOP|nr:unnamed protein product [Timema cristinae]CAD7426769.1 unnamed protein product [Timema monikensis]